MFRKTFTATIMRKGNDGAPGQCYIIIRSYALVADNVITVSQDDYDALHPGMIVNVQRLGWGAFTRWNLER